MVTIDRLVRLHNTRRHKHAIVLLKTNHHSSAKQYSSARQQHGCPSNTGLEYRHIGALMLNISLWRILQLLSAIAAINTHTHTHVLSDSVGMSLSQSPFSSPSAICLLLFSKSPSLRCRRKWQVLTKIWIMQIRQACLVVSVNGCKDIQQNMFKITFYTFFFSLFCDWFKEIQTRQSVFLPPPIPE